MKIIRRLIDRFLERRRVKKARKFLYKSGICPDHFTAVLYYQGYQCLQCESEKHEAITRKKRDAINLLQSTKYKSANTVESN